MRAAPCYGEEKLNGGKWVKKCQRGGGGPGEAMDRLAVKDQSEKQRRISNRPRELGNRPAAPLIILRSINVSLFLFIYFLIYF